MGYGDKVKADLLTFFESKPPHKQTVTFNTSDIHPSSKRNLNTEIKGKRRKLSKWLYDNMEKGPATVEGYEITVHTATVPYRYIARKVKG